MNFNIRDNIRQEIGIDTSVQYLTFLIDGQRYGMPSANIIEIVKIPPVTDMPELPHCAKGIINLRGRVIPLIDVNLRLGKAEKEYTDRTCVIIVDIDGGDVGLIVESVEEVMDIENSVISPLLAVSSNAARRYITGVAKLDEYMILLLDGSLLIKDSDMVMFAESAV